MVDHGSTAPWSWNQDPGARYRGPDEVAAELDLDHDLWEVIRTDRPQRRATGSGGRTAEVTDHVLVVHGVSSQDPDHGRRDHGHG